MFSSARKTSKTNFLRIYFQGPYDADFDSSNGIWRGSWKITKGRAPGELSGPSVDHTTGTIKGDVVSLIPQDPVVQKPISINPGLNI